MKGSTTIEASVIIPLIIMLNLLVIRGAAAIYKEMADRQLTEKYGSVWEVDEFFRYDKLKSVQNEGGEK